jgi:hypothetical protein
VKERCGAGPSEFQCEMVIILKILNISLFICVLRLIYTIGSRIIERSIVKRRRRRQLLQNALASRVLHTETAWALITGFGPLMVSTNVW